MHIAYEEHKIIYRIGDNKQNSGSERDNVQLSCGLQMWGGYVHPKCFLSFIHIWAIQITQRSHLWVSETSGSLTVRGQLVEGLIDKRQRAGVDGTEVQLQDSLGFSEY